MYFKETKYTCIRFSKHVMNAGTLASAYSWCWNTFWVKSWPALAIMSVWEDYAKLRRSMFLCKRQSAFNLASVCPIKKSPLKLNPTPKQHHEQKGGTQIDNHSTPSHWQRTCWWTISADMHLTEHTLVKVNYNNQRSRNGTLSVNSVI